MSNRLAGKTSQRHKTENISENKSKEKKKKETLGSFYKNCIVFSSSIHYVTHNVCIYITNKL